MAYLFALLIKKSEATLQLYVLCYSLIPLTLIGKIIGVLDKAIGNAYPTFSNYFGYVFAIYGMAIIWRIFYLVAYPRKLISLIAVLSLYTLSGLSSHFYKNYYSFWYAASPKHTEEENYYAEYEKLDAESLMYKQSALLDKALAQIKPQRKHHGDIYFVGFAPYAMQDVFYKEITYAKDLMDKRFDTQSRSVNLINHLKTTDTLPLATGTNLGITLKHIGKLMDKDEDILVLYLTSHGSKEHELSVNFYPMALNDLTPAKLKTMLDEAGIKWRVVIVSACYSGGYIKPLQNPNTLIATAAAADKTSFGCGNEFDFTYFGQALFKDQLNHQTSLISALKQAEIEIGKREVREKKEPSNPQLSVGANIEVKLNSLEKTVIAYQCNKNYQATEKC